MHADLAKGGVLNVHELVDFPGVTIADHWETRGSKGVRKIIFDDEEFPTIGDAIEAWKWRSKPSSD